MPNKFIWYTRYYISRELLRLGLIILPEGKYKTELIKRVHGLRDEVAAVVSVYEAEVNKSE